MSFLQNLGQWLITKLQGFLYAFGFFWTVIKEAVRWGSRSKVGFNVIVMQILFTGVNALSIITLISLSLGTVIIIQGATLLASLGQGKLMYTILITVITKELGPLLVAFIVMARSGVAIATEIGNMVVNHEIEAYQAVGINPINYLVVPRFIGVTVSMIVLNLYFSLIGLGASWLMAILVQPVPASEYFFNLLASLNFKVIFASLLKSLAFGVVIAVVSSYNGFRANTASTEIPVIVIRAVGQGFVMIILVNILITLVTLF